MKHAFASSFSTVGKIDREAGIIHGVSLATVGPARGWGIFCDQTTLSQLLSVAQTYGSGVKVKMDHSGGPADFVGTLRSLRIDGNQLRGDLHLLQSYERRDYVFEIAEKMPDTFGLSIAFSGPVEKIGEKTFARVTELYSCDIVSEPAANPNGLFSRGVDADAKEAIPALTMTESDVKTLIATALSEFSAKFTALESAVEDVKKQFASVTSAVEPLRTECAALKTSLTELSAKLGDEQKRVELAARTVAAEFSKHIGTVTVPADGGGSAGGKGAPAAPADATAAKLAAFDATLTKHFEATNSKSAAWRLAAVEDGAGYQLFLAAKRKPSFELARK